MSADFVERHLLDGRDVMDQMIGRMIWRGASYIEHAFEGGEFVVKGWRLPPYRQKQDPAE